MDYGSILLFVLRLVFSTCILCVALSWLLKCLNDDGKFKQAEEEYLRWIKFDDLAHDNPIRKAGYN